MFDYKFLLLAEEKGKRTVECHNTAENVSLKKLLDGVENSTNSIVWERLVINYPNISEAFESLCKDLFRLEYFDQDTVFQSDPNNPGIEIHPKKALNGKYRGKMISFQSKYFRGRVQYKDINSSGKETIEHYSGSLDVMVLYCNQKLSSKSCAAIKKELQTAGIELVTVVEDELRNRICKYPELSERYFFI